MLYDGNLNQLSELERLKFKRGLQVIRKNLFISLTIYLTSYFLGILTEVFIVHACYFIIRYFSFGAHLKSFWLCIIQSLVTFVLIPYMMLNYFPAINLKLPAIIAVIITIAIGPQPTRVHPVHSYTLKSLWVKTSIAVGILLAIGLLLSGKYSLLIFYGMMIQSITLIITFIGRK